MYFNELIECCNKEPFPFVCSLLKVHLQLRGFSVFLDIERLNAGKFDEGLLTSIAQSKNFILVLTADALERCVGDTQRKDWVHRVSRQAGVVDFRKHCFYQNENNRNICNVDFGLLC